VVTRIGRKVRKGLSVSADHKVWLIFTPRLSEYPNLRL